MQKSSQFSSQLGQPPKAFALRQPSPFGVQQKSLYVIRILTQNIFKILSQRLIELILFTTWRLFLRELDFGFYSPVCGRDE